MSARKPALTKAQLEHYDRLMLRSALVSLFWGVIADRKMRRGYKLQELAQSIGMDKSGVSRWFSGSAPNWTLDTIADIANALNVVLRVEAVERDTGTVYTSKGREPALRSPEQAIPEAEPPDADANTLISKGRKTLAHSQPARARNEDELRIRHPRKKRQHKGSRVP